MQQILDHRGDRRTGTRGELVHGEVKTLDLKRQRWLPSLDMLETALKAGADIPAESSRGCPGNCTFCSIPQIRRISSPKEPWRRFSVGRTAKLVEKLVEGGVSNINFVDSEFGSRDPKYLLDVAAKFREQGKPRFGIDLRLDALGQVIPKEAARYDKILKKMKAAGLDGVFVGAESGSSSQLKRYCKGSGLEVHLRGLERLARAGLTPDIGFITFDPLVTRHEILDNLKFLETEVGARPGVKGTPLYLFVSSPLNVMRVQQRTAEMLSMRLCSSLPRHP